MPIVPAKCTACGSILEVDSSQDAINCQHCGTAFIVEKAVTNYNASIQMDGGVINIGGASLNQFLVNAETFQKFGEIDKALDNYEKACENFPNDWRGWWGQFCIATNEGKNITELSASGELAGSIFAERAIAVGAPGSVTDIFQRYKQDTSEWTAACQNLWQKKEQLEAIRQNELRNIRSEFNEKIDVLENDGRKIDDNLMKYNYFKFRNYVRWGIWTAIGCYLVCFFEEYSNEAGLVGILAGAVIIAAGITKVIRRNALWKRKEDLEKQIEDITNQKYAAADKESDADYANTPEYKKAKELYDRLESEGKVVV